MSIDFDVRGIAREKSSSGSADGKNPSAWDGLDAGSVAQADWNGGKEQIGQERSINGTQKQLDWAAWTARTDSGPVMWITPDELIRLAPQLKPYLAKGSPSWPEIVEAADWLRHDLGVSKPLWGEACMAMGREHAAIALAIVSAKPAGYFRGSAGGYFHGMVAKARDGDLNLSRTIWGMRSGHETMRIRGSAVVQRQPGMTSRT